MKLKRTHQCKKCPWKVSTDPHDIPHGYDVEKHRALRETIAGNNGNPFGPSKVMSCHEHSDHEGVYCVGWLVNQLGLGNNIGLRLRMLKCENIRDIVLDGEQHKTFEDTLPNDG